MPPPRQLSPPICHPTCHPQDVQLVAWPRGGVKGCAGCGPAAGPPLPEAEVAVQTAGFNAIGVLGLFDLHAHPPADRGPATPTDVHTDRHNHSRAHLWSRCLGGGCRGMGESRRCASWTSWTASSPSCAPTGVTRPSSRQAAHRQPHNGRGGGQFARCGPMLKDSSHKAGSLAWTKPPPPEKQI